MKILIYSIFYHPEPTGIGKYTGEMVEWLAHRGHTVSVIAPPPYYPHWKIYPGYSGWWYKRQTKGDVRIFRCPIWIPSQNTAWGRVLLRISFAAASAPILLWLCLRWRPQVVFAVTPPLTNLPAALLGSRLAGAQSWLHVQDLEVDLAAQLFSLAGPWKETALRLEKLLLSKFQRISSITPRMLARLGKRLTGKRSPYLFSNWVDPQDIYPLARQSAYRGQLGISSSQVVALYSGNMGRKQGLELLIEAAKRVAERKDITLVICGDGTERERLRHASAGVDNLVWLPIQPADRLNELLNLADIHLLPQKEEVADLAMPSKLGGMLASGRPVVACARADTQIADEIATCGIRVSPGDADGIAAALIELAGQPAMRQALGESARQQACRNWDKTSILQKFEAVLVSG